MAEKVDARKKVRGGDVVGMLMSTVWLAVLVPAILSFINGDFETHVRVIGLLLTAIYVGVYLFVIHLAFDGRANRYSNWVAVATVAALVAIVVGLFALIGGRALAYPFFLIPALNFLLPLRWASVAGFVVAIGIGIAGAEVGGMSGVFGAGASAMGVHLMTFGSRYFMETGQKEKELATKTAVVDERERVARDVHDVLGHMLTLIALKSDLAGKMIERDPDKAAIEIREINQLSRAAIAEVRSTVSGLRAQKLVDELSQGVEALEKSGIAVTVEGRGCEGGSRPRLAVGPDSCRVRSADCAVIITI